MIKHTPGPWSRAPGATNGLDISCAHVGTVQSENWHVALVFADGDIGRETAEANASLIASSPRLLAICKRALAIEESVTQGVERELSDGYVIELRAAIAEAEGAS